MSDSSSTSGNTTTSNTDVNSYSIETEKIQNSHSTNTIDQTRQTGDGQVQSTWSGLWKSFVAWREGVDDSQLACTCTSLSPEGCRCGISNVNVSGPSP